MRTMGVFLNDYDAGRSEGRYVAASPPHLPFESGSFDLALSSHFLFLYDHMFDTEPHRAAIAEMLRVSHEARIFPILNLDGKRSGLLAEVVRWIGLAGGEASVERVPYEYQRGGNEMLRIQGPLRAEVLA